MDRATTASRRMISAACIVIAALSIVSLLWFIRAHYFNASNAGWGDLAEDRHQALLGWGIVVSAIVAAVSVAFLAIRSRRALLSLISGAVLSVLSLYLFWWVAPGFPRAPVMAWIFLFPGTVLSLYTFGFHAGGDVAGVYALIIDASFYSIISFVLLPRRLYTRRVSMPTPLGTKTDPS